MATASWRGMPGASRRSIPRWPASSSRASIEQTVHREVYEEVGLKVGNLRYFGSQSPFPNSLMIAYTADYVSGEIRVQEDEILEARWFGPGDPMPRSQGACPSRAR